MERRSSSRISIQIPKPASDADNSSQKQLLIHPHDDVSSPLQIVRPDQFLTPVPAATRSSPSAPAVFQLPEDWIVEKRRRKLASPGGSPVIDKYYIEPGSERRFRSLLSVQRYLAEGEEYEQPKPKATKPARHYQNKMEVVPCVHDCDSQLGLPYGWLVEIRPRSDPTKFDRYYIEPGSGRKFRSLPSVQRYLNGEEEYAARRKAINSGHDRRNMQVFPSVFKSGSQLGLPSGWRIELRPRTDGSRFDKYYEEPETGRKFRSLSSVQKYIAEEEELTTSLGALVPMSDKVAGKLKMKRLVDLGGNSAPTMPCHPGNKPPVDTKEETGAVTPRFPTRIKWVFNGKREDTWSPSVDGSPVPDSEVRGWSEAFMLTMDSQ